jgi:hypothetical protein
VQPNAPGSAGYNPYAYANGNPATFTDPSGHLVDRSNFGGGVAGAFYYLAYVMECFLSGNCLYRQKHALIALETVKASQPKCRASKIDDVAIAFSLITPQVIGGNCSGSASSGVKMKFMDSGGWASMYCSEKIPYSSIWNGRDGEGPRGRIVRDEPSGWQIWADPSFDTTFYSDMMSWCPAWVMVDSLQSESNFADSFGSFLDAVQLVCGMHGLRACEVASWGAATAIQIWGDNPSTTNAAKANQLMDVLLGASESRPRNGVVYLSYHNNLSGLKTSETWTQYNFFANEHTYKQSNPCRVDDNLQPGESNPLRDSTCQWFSYPR